MGPQFTKKRRWLAVARANAKVYVWLAPVLGVLGLVGTTLIGVSLAIGIAGLVLAAGAGFSQILQNWWVEQEAESRLQKAESSARGAYNAAVVRHTILADQLGPIARTIALMAEQRPTELEATFQKVVTQAVNSIMLAIANVSGLRAVVYEVAADGQSMKVVSWNARTSRAAPHPFLRGSLRGDAAFALLVSGESMFVSDIASAPDKWAGSGVGYNTFISCPISSPDVGYGLLTVDAKNTDDLVEEDVTDIRLLAGILANAFAERARPR